MSIGTESVTPLMSELSQLLERAAGALVTDQRLAGPAAPQDHPNELVPNPSVGSVGIGFIWADDAVMALSFARPYATELAGSADPAALQNALGDLIAAIAGGRSVEISGVVGLASDDELIAFLSDRPGLVGAGLFEGEGVIATFGAAGAVPATAAPEAPAPSAADAAATSPQTTVPTGAPAAPAPQPTATDPAAQPDAVHIAPAAGAAHAPLQPSVPDERLARGLAMLADVHLEVTAELGRTRLRVSDLLSLEPGSVIGLEREAGSPVDLLVNGTLFARAEVIVVDNQYAVRITELVGDGVPQ